MDFRVIALSVGQFVTACGALIVIGLLNEIAADLDVSVAVAGLLGAGFSVCAAVFAPVLGVLGSHITRRNVLVSAMGVHALCAFGSALAPSFAILLASRAFLGATVGAYIPASVSTAGMMTPPERRGQAIFLISLGGTIAQVLGVPLGVWFGGLAGWRMTMLLFGVLAAVSTLWLWRVIPADLRSAPFGRDSWRELRGDRAILATLLVSLLQAMGSMQSLTYLAPLLRDSLDAAPGDIGIMLSVFGFCGVLSSLIGMRIMDRVGPQRLSQIAFAMMIGNFLLWPLAQDSFLLTGLALGLWGAGFVLIATSQQTRMVLINPGLAPVSVAFNTSCVFCGGAMGAALGSLVITTLGLHALTWVSLALASAGLAVLLLAGGPSTRAASQPSA